MVQSQESAKKNLDPIFLSRELVSFKAKSAKLNTDGTFLWLAQNILVQHPQPRHHISEFCHVNHTISRHWYDCPQPRIIFSHFTQAKYHQITRKNSAYWQIDTSWLLSHIRFIRFPDVRSHGRQTSIDPVFTPKSLDPDQSSPAILLSSNSFDSWKLVPDVKALVVTLEKRAISYLSVRKSYHFWHNLLKN